MKNWLTVIMFLGLSLTSYGQVHLQTGSAELNIPIYSFADNLSRLKFGLSIDYSSGSGLVVDHLPGSLGSQWQLGGIPKVIRIQKGLPDDQNGTSGTPSGIVLQDKLIGIRGCPKVLNYYPLSESSAAVYDDPLIVANDWTVDEFQVFLNGRMITFYLRTKSGFNQDGSAITILNSKDEAKIIAYTDMQPNDNIVCRTMITRFEILDSDGLTYIFSLREYSKIFKYSVPQSWMQTNVPMLAFREEVIDPNETYIASAWSLSKIIDKKNQREINFNYNTQTLEFENYANLYAGSDNSFSTAPPIGQYPTSAHSVYGTIKQNKIITSEILTIDFPTGEKIDFTYGNQRKDIKGAYGLKEIIIKGMNQDRLAKFTLSQSYFVKNQVKMPNLSEEKWSRLCLTGIQKYGKTDLTKEPPYLFTYYLGSDALENFVPPIFFHAKDPWGFYNGNNCGISVTNFVSKTTTPISDWRSLCSYSQGHQINGQEEIDTRCKSRYAANGLLKSYSLPEGQFVEFEYQQNIAKISTYPRAVGGVHVSKVTNNNTIGNEKQIVEYSYILPDGNSSLWGIETPRCVSKSTRHYKKINSEKYPNIYQGVYHSEEGSIFSVERIVQRYGGKIINSAISILRNPSPINIFISVLSIFIDLGSFSEQTTTQYYFHRDPLNFSNPLPSQFNRVIVKTSSFDGINIIENGRVEYEFTSDIDFPPLLPVLNPGDPNFTPHFFSQSQRSLSWMYGLPKKIETYRNKEESPIKIVENFYEAVLSNSNNDNMLTSCNCQPVYFDSKREADYYHLSSDIDENFINATILDQLYVDFIHVQSGYPILKKTIETNYSGSGVGVISTIDYEYNSRGFLNIQKVTDSKGKGIQKKTYYYNDFYQTSVRPDNIFTRMYDENRGNIPIATETWQVNPATQQEELLSSKIFEYGQVPNGDFRNIRDYTFESEFPISKNIINEFSYATPPPMNRNSLYFKINNQTNYNLQGLATQFNNIEQGKVNGVVYGYDQQYVISKFTNAAANEISYTSFETYEKNNWEYDATMIESNTSSITGNKCFQLEWDLNKAIHLSSSLPQNISKPYILSFWANASSLSIGGSSVAPLENKPINGWYFFKIYFQTGAAVPSINGGCLIDELRWYPADARMETYTYEPLIGMTSMCDANNNTIYKEYDGLGRLILIRDAHRNLLKKINYQYAAPAYFSLDKSGNYTRNNCMAGYTPGTVYVSVPAQMFSSAISQEDADNQALAYAQQHANQNASCTPQPDVSLEANNYTNSTFSVHLVNENNVEFYYYVNSNSQYIQIVPPGIYTIEIADAFNSGIIYGFRAPCGYYGNGNSYTFYGISINSGCHIIDIY